MPLSTASPQQVIAPETANIYQITSFDVDTDTLRVTLRIRYGLQQGAETTWLGTKAGSVDATPFATLIPEPGETLYACLKRVLYDQAQAAGLIPVGTVT